MTWAYQPLTYNPANWKLKYFKGKDYTYVSKVTSVAVSGRSNVRSVISNPQGTIAIATRDGNQILRMTSSAITTWTPVSIPAATRGTIGTAAWINNKFFIFTSGLGVFCSTDAITWETIRNPDPTGNDVRTGVENCIATNGSLYILAAGGLNEMLYTTTDFVNWTVLTGLTDNAYSIIWNGSTFVIAAANQNIYTTTDGATWTLQASNIGEQIILYNGTYYCILSNTYKTSTDLVSWSSSISITGITTTSRMTILNTAFNKPFNSSAAFIVNEERGRTSFSADGVNWTDLSSGSFPGTGSYAVGNLLMYDESSNGYRFVGVGSGHDKVSDNIITDVWESPKVLNRWNGSSWQDVSERLKKWNGTEWESVQW